MGQDSNLLKDAYKNSLLIADKHSITSIAFPFISSGIYGCPKELAAQIALETVVEYIKNHDTKVKVVRFVLYPPDASTIPPYDFDIFKEALEKLSL